jgi:hypothetical protein
VSGAGFRDLIVDTIELGCVWETSGALIAGSQRNNPFETLSAQAQLRQRSFKIGPGGRDPSGPPESQGIGGAVP